jgi:hypothetical protein
MELVAGATIERADLDEEHVRAVYDAQCNQMVEVEGKPGRGVLQQRSRQLPQITAAGSEQLQDGFTSTLTPAPHLG